MCNGFQCNWDHDANDQIHRMIKSDSRYNSNAGIIPNQMVCCVLEVFINLLELFV